MSSRSSIFKISLVLFQSYSLKSHYFSQLSHTISYPRSFLQPSRRIGGLKRLHAFSELAGLYAEFDDFESCMNVLHSTREPRTMVWNLLIKRQSELGSFDLASRVFLEMRRLGVEVDSFTVPIVNHAISMLGADGLLCGEMIHCVGVKLGFGSDVYFCNTLIEMYVKSGNVVFARKVFDDMCQRDLVSWTSMVSGYAGEGNGLQAFELFNQMRVKEVEPNSVTMITILQASSSCVSVMQGKQLHGYLFKDGLLDDATVRNSLLKAYSNWTNSEADVETLFHEHVHTNVVSWNIFISFYISKGDFIGMKQKFREMLQDVSPSVETLTVVATALSKLRNFVPGLQLHCLAIKSGLCDQVLLTCLLNLYTKCGDLDSSTRLFRELPYRITIAWSYMMSMFIEHGHHKKAIELLRKTEATGLQNKPEIIGSLLDGYADLGALHKGKEIHAYFLRNLLETNSVLETSMVNMYAKCGSISSARNYFCSMETRDVIAWTSMIEGLGTYGLGLEALKLFDQMLNEGLTPNGVTFLSLLSACAHSGLAAQGCKLFHVMKWKFQIEPELHHYTCIVDLLGRMGKLREALCMILKMQCCQDSRIWGALLAASRTYMDWKIGSYAAKRLMELEPENVGYHVVLSNMKASAEQWDEVEVMRRSVNEMDLKKTPGWSCIETKGRVVGFVSSDTSHPELGEIYDVLGLLRRQMQNLEMYCL